MFKALVRFRLRAVLRTLLTDQEQCKRVLGPSPPPKTILARDGLQKRCSQRTGPGGNPPKAFLRVRAEGL